MGIISNNCQLEIDPFVLYWMNSSHIQIWFDSVSELFTWGEKVCDAYVTKESLSPKGIIENNLLFHRTMFVKSIPSDFVLASMLVNEMSSTVRFKDSSFWKVNGCVTFKDSSFWKVNACVSWKRSL